jgi:hypothetical protein
VFSTPREISETIQSLAVGAYYAQRSAVTLDSMLACRFAANKSALDSVLCYGRSRRRDGKIR